MVARLACFGYPTASHMGGHGGGIGSLLDTLRNTRKAAEQLREDVQRNPLYAGSLVSHDSRNTSRVLYLDDVSCSVAAIHRRRTRSADRTYRAGCGPENDRDVHRVTAHQGDDVEVDLQESETRASPAPAVWGR
ncbi:MAG: hypothetical protein ABGW98_06145 [Myxococcales bacterium]